MKKIFLTVVLFASVLMLASAQTNTTNNLDAKKVVNSVPSWSIGLKSGFNYIRVVPSGSSYLDQIGWNAPGFFVERTLNPFIGFGGDVSYFNYDRTSAKGNSIDFSLFTSLNITNLIAADRTGFLSKVNVYTNFGAGLGLSQYKLIPSGRSQTNLINPFTYGGLNLDYSLSNKISLCLEGQYRSYLREDMGGMGGAQFYTDGLVGTVGLRFKLGTSETKKHMRDMLPTQSNTELILLTEKVKKTDETVQNNIQTISTLELTNKSLNSQIVDLKAGFKKQNDSIQAVNNVKFDKMDKDIKELSIKPAPVVVPVATTPAPAVKKTATPVRRKPVSRAKGK
jgi:hypothetical protein